MCEPMGKRGRAREFGIETPDFVIYMVYVNPINLYGTRAVPVQIALLSHRVCVRSGYSDEAGLGA